MTPRYTARRSDYPGNPFWRVIDATTGTDAEWSTDYARAEKEAGAEYSMGYTEAHARAVADWLNQHDTTHPDDIPAESAGTLHDYLTGEYLRAATPSEAAESIQAARQDGGPGVIRVGGRLCYVNDRAPF